MAGKEEKESVHTSSPTRDLAKHLSGIDFPADRNKIVEYARSHNVDQETIQRLQNLPDERYESMADVFKGFGQTE